MSAGWKHARARSLWDLWGDSQFLDDMQRMSLDTFEAFDEWEEFAIFASHYFLLIAATRTQDTGNNTQNKAEETCNFNQCLSLAPLYPPGFTGQRRFGSIVPIKGGRVGLHGGWGLQTRLSSTQVYSESEEKHSIQDLPPTSIPARMCHSTTILGSDCLLSGGRASPTMPFGDCWLGSNGKWEQVDSLPVPCFRHSTAAIDLDQDGRFVLLFGGKSATGDVLGQFSLWSEHKGWNAITVAGSTPRPRFGALMISIDGRSGIMCGGMSRQGLILNDFWYWKVVKSDDGSLYLNLIDLTKTVSAATSFRWLSRFGATANLLEDNIVIVGGVNVDGCIPQRYEVMLLHLNALRLLMENPHSNVSDLLTPAKLEVDSEVPRPLFVGHSSITVGNDKVLIVGGGAVCFSFGTFWNKGTLLLQNEAPDARNNWHLVEPAVNSEQSPARSISPTTQPDLSTADSLVAIPRIKITSPQEFRTIVDKSRPVILEGLNIGRCVQAWTKEYIQGAVGYDRKVCAFGWSLQDIPADNNSIGRRP